jgi:hypothetical protein
VTKGVLEGAKGIYDYAKEMFPRFMKYIRDNTNIKIAIGIAVTFLLSMVCIFNAKPSEVVEMFWDFIATTFDSVFGGVILSLGKGIPVYEGAMNVISKFMDRLMGLLKTIFIFVMKKVEDLPILAGMIRVVRQTCDILKKKVKLAFKFLDRGFEQLTQKMKNYSGPLETLPRDLANSDKWSLYHNIPTRNWPKDPFLISNYPASDQLMQKFSIRDLFAGDGQHIRVGNLYKNVPQKYIISEGIRLYKGVEDIFEFALGDVDIFRNRNGTLYGRGLYTSTVKDVAYMYAREYIKHSNAGLVTFKLKDDATLDQFKGIRTMTSDMTLTLARDTEGKKVEGVFVKKKSTRDDLMDELMEKFKSSSIESSDLTAALASINDEYSTTYEIDKSGDPISFIMPSENQGVIEQTYFIIVDENLMKALTIEKIEVFRPEIIRRHFLTHRDT